MTIALDRVPPVSFNHLTTLTGDHGLFEHAEYLRPRQEHGHCTDDVARALTVVVRHPDRTAELERLTDLYLSFLEEAVTTTGQVHNRRSADGEWTDEPTTDDWWGRAVGGLGSAVRHGSPPIADRALVVFLRAARQRSSDVRASAFAAIGAADVLFVHADLEAAGALLADCLDRIPRPSAHHWGWAEPTLRYANAALCSALITGGAHLSEPTTIQDGLSTLASLLLTETGPTGILSVTGTAGRCPGEQGPLWDQQPIEPAAISDACARALHVTGDQRWAAGIHQAWAWFLGSNDAGTTMYDPTRGAGYDGLERQGRNENCGAESTLAALSTHQDVLALAATRR